ncbi:hypothetical protein GCM10017744_094990 [Streptomyces antimycoticus]|uniref:Uncharacterized protein n=1 Tax=Streptomyces antimycoticus TaxID=68175 RepID=A0A4D4K1P6_9ACTN|nr:hypothetical protein SANT12839_007150 [Streptomyces antimycoticus]
MREIIPTTRGLREIIPTGSGRRGGDGEDVRYAAMRRWSGEGAGVEAELGVCLSPFRSAARFDSSD